jgi:hypothetical protein
MVPWTVTLLAIALAADFSHVHSLATAATGDVDTASLLHERADTTCSSVQEPQWLATSNAHLLKW